MPKIYSFSKATSNYFFKIIQSPAYLLCTIIVLSLLLRFYQLGSNPPGLDWDETAHGYNAYSILKTGRDEYGYKFPLSFRSFDDYKPPLYTYLVVPSVKAFGLSNYAVRFPSAFLGSLAVLFTYLMVYELFKNKKIALLTAFFLATSPWHLQFSRVAFETNSTIFWTVLGTWGFLRGVKTRGINITLWLSLTALAFGANLYMYHNSRVFIPLFSLLLAALFKRQLLSIKKHLVLPVIIISIFIGTLIPVATSISGQLRYIGTSVFGDKSPIYKASDLLSSDVKDGQGLEGKIIHNRRLVYAPIIIENYLSHFRPTYLFFTADMDRHHAPLIGLLYLWDLPFLLCGLYFLISKKYDQKNKWAVFGWFLLAPIAASVTWGVPHSLRTEVYLPTFQIFTAFGVYFLTKYLKKLRIFTSIIVILLFINFFFYLHQYYVHMPLEFSKSWLYGRREAAIFSESIKNNYDRVIVSTALEQPHEFWLYYLKYDPKKYQDEGGTVSGGFLEDKNKFDKYLFKPIHFNDQLSESKTLFVGLPTEFPKGANILKKINYLNGEPAIFIVDGNEN
jgi:4-amino-4-deoxy-L-arabinose transferase-like glycosyltransferase